MGAPLFTIDRDVAGFGLGENVRLANAHVALTFATGVGPRILGFGLRGGENLFGFVPAAPGDGLRDPSRFRLFGGHRL